MLNTESVELKGFELGSICSLETIKLISEVDIFPNQFISSSCN
jgi:hypothetical protein